MMLMHSTAGYSFSPTATCRHPERGGGVQTITSKPLQNDIKILSFQVWKEGGEKREGEEREVLTKLLQLDILTRRMIISIGIVPNR